MPDEEREDRTLDAALPKLGAFVERPRRVVAGHDPEHGEHTFDFAGRRPDGRQVAIEVTQATYESYERDRRTLTRTEIQLGDELRDRGVPAGTFLLSTSQHSPRIKEFRERLFDEAARLEEDHEVNLGVDVWLHRQSRDDGAVAFYWGSGAGGALAQEHAQLFVDAIADCAPKLVRAEGYETILLIEPFWLGAEDTWQTAFRILSERGNGSQGIGCIWAVSLADGMVTQLR